MGVGKGILWVGTTPRITGHSGSSDRHLGVALQGFFSPFQISVLVLISILIGYICILVTKLLEITDISLGIGAVALLAFLLLTLDTNRSFWSADWWWRTFIAIIICLVIVAPQLNSAWKVSVAEARASAEAQQNRKVLEERRRYVAPDIKIFPRPQPAIGVRQ
jgi:hypothetical protein